MLFQPNLSDLLFAPKSSRQACLNGVFHSIFSICYQFVMDIFISNCPHRDWLALPRSFGLKPGCTTNSPKSAKKTKE